MKVEYLLTIPTQAAGNLARIYRAKTIAHRDGLRLAKLYGQDRHTIARIVQGDKITVLGETTYRAR